MDDKETNQWAAILHFSLFSGFVIPLGGLIVPIVIWQLKKADLPGIDPHGKVVVNWIISLFIYLIVSSLLTLVVIGFLLIPIFGIMAIVFPIVGGIQASSGRLWKYPLSIEFIK